GVRFDDLPAISLVLLSHNHYDHCDLRTLRALGRRFQPRLVTPLGNGRLLQSAGIRDVEELDWWQSASAAPLPVTLTPAQHFSARGPFDRNRALWGGFLIEARGRRILFAGDSGYGPHFREIAARLSPVDLALLPIGAYEPRWFMQDIHMNPAEAVQAHVDLGARRSLAMHYGTFQLTPEGVDEPVRELTRALRERGGRGGGQPLLVAVGPLRDERLGVHLERRVGRERVGDSHDHAELLLLQVREHVTCEFGGRVGDRTAWLHLTRRARVARDDRRGD